MSLFITVGSTGFDDLISKVTSQPFLISLASLSIAKICVQYGSSEPIYINQIQQYDGPRIDITGYKYKPSITEDMNNADIIISHAGSGNILQASRLHKKLIVVVNSKLMDNHQSQIAEAMKSRNYATCSEINDLLNTIATVKGTEFTPFPDAKPETFAGIVDQHMGF